MNKKPVILNDGSGEYIGGFNLIHFEGHGGFSGGIDGASGDGGGGDGGGGDGGGGGDWGGFWED